MAYVPPHRRGPPQQQPAPLSPGRNEERRHRATAKVAVKRRTHRRSAETPLSGLRSEAAIPLPDGKIPLSTLDAPPFIIKLFNKPDGSLGSDYYLIQREFAKRAKRPTATRAWLKVVAMVFRRKAGGASEYLMGRTRDGATAAIGSVSSDHVYNEGIRRRLGLGGGSLSLQDRAVASALGEAREELRVRPNEVAGIHVAPICLVVPDGSRPDRKTVYLFIDLELVPGISLATLEARRRKDRDESPSFNEVGELLFVNGSDLFNPRIVGQRTRDLLGAMI